MKPTSVSKVTSRPHPSTEAAPSVIYIDESRLYTETAKEDATPRHQPRCQGRRPPQGRCRGSYNTIENMFSVFKRGMIGVYQHYTEAHLHRYLAESDFRYNRRAALKWSDVERSSQLLAFEGKRLTYRRIGEASSA